MSRRQVRSGGLIRSSALLSAVVALFGCRVWAGGFVMGTSPRRPAPAPATEVARPGLGTSVPGKQDQKYLAYVDNQLRLKYISALDPSHLNETVQMLQAFASSFRRTMSCGAPAWEITVVLPTADDYARMMPKSDDFAGRKPSGVYQWGKRRLVSIDRGRVLRHEFVHALHHADSHAAKQVHPIWILEGLATLFENARVTSSVLEPHIDTRVWTLQRAIRTREIIPLETLFQMKQRRFMERADLTYAQARYVLLYLHEKGQLGNWYARYKATYQRDPSGAKAVQSALGRGLAQIEQEWKRWIGDIKLRGNADRPAGRGWLGVTMTDDSRGVKITSLIPGGAAQRAGRLFKGDIVQKFNGVSTRNTAQLAAAIRAAGAMKTVRVDLLRRGHQQVIYQPLTSPQAVH